MNTNSNLVFFHWTFLLSSWPWRAIVGNELSSIELTKYKMSQCLAQVFFTCRALVSCVPGYVMIQHRILIWWRTLKRFKNSLNQVIWEFDFKQYSLKTFRYFQNVIIFRANHIWPNCSTGVKFLIYLSVFIFEFRHFLVNKHKIDNI